MFSSNSKKVQILNKIWKLQGLLPFYYDDKDNYKFSWAGLFLGLSYLVWSIPMCLWALYLDLKNDYNNSIKTVNKIMTVVTCFNLLSLFLVSTVIIIFTSIQARNISEITLLVYQIKKQLGSPKHWEKVDSIGLFLQVVYIILLSMKFIFSWDKIKYDFPSNFLYLIVFSVVIQILTLSVKIGLLFKTLNEKILTIFLKYSSFPRILPSINVLKGRNRNLTDYCEIHWTLCRVIYQFNYSFGVQVLAIFFVIFQLIISAPFFIIVTLSQDYTTIQVFNKVMLDVIWLIVDIAMFSLIIWPCAMSTGQGSKTSAIICKYLTKDLPNDLKKQCEEFLFQLQHHKTSFFAYGIIRIDWPVLTNVLGAISTYLFILIQFQSTSLK